MVACFISALHADHPQGVQPVPRPECKKASISVDRSTMSEVSRPCTAYGRFEALWVLAGINNELHVLGDFGTAAMS